MIRATCHCGAVCIDIDHAPEEVTECNCSICRRYGVLWAYYAPSQVAVVEADPPTDTYMWDDRAIAFHRCRICGCVTHWAAVDPVRDQMGINARLLPPEVLARARVRHLDGANTEQYVD
jgi:hypothetical protein